MPEVILEDLFILEKNLSYVILDGLTAMELSQHFIALRNNGKKTKLKKFEEIANPTALFKINGKKVSKQKYNAEMKKIEKKYPLKQIWSFDTFELTTDNINNLVKNYKSFIITGKKF